MFDAKLVEFELTLSDPVHEFDAGDGRRGSSKMLEAEHRTSRSLTDRWSCSIKLAVTRSRSSPPNCEGCSASCDFSHCGPSNLQVGRSQCMGRLPRPLMVEQSRLPPTSPARRRTTTSLRALRGQGQSYSGVILLAKDEQV